MEVDEARLVPAPSESSGGSSPASLQYEYACTVRAYESTTAAYGDDGVLIESPLPTSWQQQEAS